MIKAVTRAGFQRPENNCSVLDILNLNRSIRYPRGDVMYIAVNEYMSGV